VAAALDTVPPGERQAARRLLERLADHLGANASALVIRAQAKTAKRRGRQRRIA
jgi:hypothetical protein